MFASVLQKVNMELRQNKKVLSFPSRKPGCLFIIAKKVPAACYCLISRRVAEWPDLHRNHMNQDCLRKAMSCGLTQNNKKHTSACPPALFHSQPAADVLIRHVNGPAWSRGYDTVCFFSFFFPPLVIFTWGLHQTADELISFFCPLSDWDGCSGLNTRQPDRRKSLSGRIP